ncbi:sigma-54-dependent Fis family transcriptional regulator [bacterium]|nr:MAG: sigma-54-dependent Fis family transcriptional regulator [bacterium]
MENTKLLVVDDEKIVRESLHHWFEEEGYLVDTADRAEDALNKFDKGKYDLCLLDMKMPGMSGLDLLKKMKQIDPDSIVILITAYASVSSAIKALKDGAYDYITKPVDPEELEHLVKKAVEQKKLRNENDQLKENIEEIIRPDNLIGESAQMKKIYELINTVAQTDTTVLIRGESGTGKELVAKAIHMNSKRKYFPIVTVTCGTLEETILGSELFGYEKGAFAGAHHRRKGKFEMADGGTIFLDEIGSISTKLQIDLLRVLESRQFTRVGGSETLSSDFRIIAATNELLDEKVKAGKFREDLYYRLNIFTIVIPPLRERKEDIAVLSEYFVSKFAVAMNKNNKKFCPDAMDFMIKYDWPGNVRELENAVERAMVVGKSETIQVDDLPFHVSQNVQYDDTNLSLSAMERKHIKNILDKNHWNISRSAEVLQIDRVTLYHKIEKYGFRRNKR